MTAMPDSSGLPRGSGERRCRNWALNDCGFSDGHEGVCVPPHRIRNRDDAPMTILADGTTKSGTHIYAEQTGDHPLDVTIKVNGEEVALTALPQLFRDGGTRKFPTTAGTLILPHRIQSADRVPRWNGEPLGELPPEVVEEQRKRERKMRDIARRESGGSGD